MYNFLINNPNLLLTLNKNFSYIEFEFIFKFLKKFNFVQVYKYFKTFEILFDLPDLCIKCFPKLDNFKLLNIKLIKFFFLINCIQLIKKKNLINFIFNNLNNLTVKYNKKINLNSSLITNYLNLKAFTYSPLKEKFLKKKIKNLQSLFIIAELYKTYKGVIIPFNISNLSWLVRAGLKYDMKLYLIILIYLLI
jgi:hypothetical protein